MLPLATLALAALLQAQPAKPTFGNAACKGHIPDNPTAPALRTRHCTFLIGDPAHPDQLALNSLPVNEPLLVLGRSAAMQGVSHGTSWYLVKTRDNRQGYVPEYDLQCTASEKECDAASAKTLP